MTTETTVATCNARRHATQSHEPRWPLILMTPDVSEAPDVPTETEYVVRAN
ncbi:glutamine amidotransferase, partial [Rhizobium ruizarguesonis]